MTTDSITRRLALGAEHVTTEANRREFKEDSMENKDVNKWSCCDKCGELFPEDELVRYALMTLCKKCHAETENT